jgi:O-antigen/teichoic acid export membrane protein
MAILGGILAFAGGIGLLVFWVMTLIKQFKAQDILWGVLTIFIGILAPIWAFMNGHKQLGINFIIAFIVYILGFILLMVGGLSGMEGLEM